MKKAFTLIEVILSISLLVIIFAYFYQSVAGLRKSTSFYEKKFKDIEETKKIISMIQRDIFLSIEPVELPSLTNKDYSILKLRSLNSIYNIDAPYIIWYVSKEKNTLTRIESSIKFNIPINEKYYKYNLDEIQKDVNKFKIYLSKDKKNVLVYLQMGTLKPFIFEIATTDGMTTETPQEQNTTQ